MGWRFHVADLAGVAVGELRNAANRSVSFGVNRNAAAGFRLRLDDPLADTLLDGASLLKVYDDADARFLGRITSAEEVAGQQSASLAFTASGPLERLSGRLVGKAEPGYRDGSPTAQVDRSTLLANLLAAANAEGYTGIDVGTVTASGSTAWAEWAPYKPALDAFNELAFAAGGPDFALRFQEPQAVAAGTRLALLDVAAAIGQERPDVVFEYGTGRRNVAEYRRAVSYDLVNALYGLPPTDRPDAPVVTAEDAASIAAYGRFEALRPTDLSVDTLRQAVVDEDVRVRKAPRQVVSFTPSRPDPDRPGRVPRFGVDYDLGDAVRFRAVNPTTGVVRVNAMLRVYGISYAIDELGAATPSLTLTAD